jgi:hypothetical protein
MKNVTLFLYIVLLSQISFAQTMIVHKKDASTVNFQLSQIDSITFSLSPNIDSGLVAYYPFNGNADDESGNGNNGTNHGSTLISDRFGNDSSAYSFDGNDYIDVPFNPAFNIAGPFTIQAWINKLGGISSGQIQEVLTRRQPVADSVNYELYIQNDGGIVKVTVRYTFNGPGNGNDRYTTVTYNVVDGNWHHIVGLFTGSSLELYIDGILQGSTPTTEIPDVYSRDGLNIGREPNPAYYYTGKIDDIRLYNRALSEAEIQALYHEGGW